ncbi:hypothetical protein ACFRAQ_36260 [Nocardia sp. NPDC056611]|uniref:hypothetical protein n=1 Tax=Nocardia sp. NPDC056611 TaxID=3345877 RepID=UPI00366D3B20
MFKQRNIEEAAGKVIGDESFFPEIGSRSTEELRKMLTLLDKLLMEQAELIRAPGGAGQEGIIWPDPSTPVSLGDLNAHLTQARRRVVDALVERQQQEQIAQIRDVVDLKVDDPVVRSEVLAVVSRTEAERADLVKQLHEIEVQRAVRLADQQVNKTKWENRKAILEREPAAVLIGGVLLLILALALVIAMFTRTTPLEVVSSAFLLILGFFFGQNSSGKGKSGE